MSPINPAKQSGFSLVELLIATVIIGMGVLVVGNIPSAIDLIGSSQSESKVREIIAKELEDIRLTGYDNLELGTFQIADPKLDNLTGIEATTLIDNCPSEVCVNGELIKRVTISVAWSEKNKPKTIQIVTLVAKDGLK